jgi:hypothetical protein
MVDLRPLWVQIKLSHRSSKRENFSQSKESLNFAVIKNTQT